MIAKLHELLGQMPREFEGGEDLPPEPSGKFLEPRRHVHRGADAGEIEPPSPADIAVERLADMQSQAEADLT